MESKVKIAWQNPETNLFEIKVLGAESPDQILNEKELETLMELMQGFSWIIITWNKPETIIKK